MCSWLGAKAYYKGPIPILVRLGYFSFLAPPNLLAGSLPGPYNLIHGAKGWVSLVTPRPVRAAFMLFENSGIRADVTVQA